MVRISPRILDNRIKAAKAGIDLPTVAGDLGKPLTKRGERWRGMCPLCENGDNSDAFSCDERLFYCFACGIGGDVVRLVERWGPFSVGEAVAWLGQTYNLDLPGRPESWFKKQSRQARLREAIEAERQELKRRRLFKYFILPELEEVAEPDRTKEMHIAWERFKKVPLG